jgi:hypothetical protein
MHPDTGYSNFCRIYEKYHDDIPSFSEADTRAKIIDQILLQCLGWDEDSIKREYHTDTGIIDYKLSIRGACKLVIEAKRTGEYFAIPATTKRKTYKVGGTLYTIPNLRDALRQAQRYCSGIGYKYAVVTNGYQLVIFSAMTIGKPWTEGYCMVFHSLDDIQSNFSLFWNVLSKESVDSGSLIKYIDKGKKELTFKKLISEVHNPDTSWARNELYTYIRPLSELIFGELLDEQMTEILKQCYVFERSNRELGDELETYFIDKLPHFAQKYRIKDIYEREFKAGVFEKEYFRQQKERNKGSIIVLVGGIGSGKSTFLHRFFRIVLGDHENLLWFYIDFRNVTLKEEELEDYIVNKILGQWKDKYEAKLGEILEKHGFAVSTDDVKNYLDKLFTLLRTVGFSLTVILDNVDRYDINFQEKIFLLASHLTDIFITVTVVALREETFLTSTRTGVFDAYDIPKFHISSPNFLSMIKARLDFTIEFLKAGEGNYARKVRNDLIKYFLIIKQSLEKDNIQSKKLIDFIDSISVGNMRDALRMFNYFTVSGNTNVKEIFKIYDESRPHRYQIAYHQFIKSIILGEYKYYSEERSQLMNVLDFDFSLTDSHFNILRILQYLLERNNKRSPIGKGYVSIDSLIAAGEEASIRRDVISDSLLRMSMFGLVEFDNQSRTALSNASYVKITHAGRYYLKSLIYEFVYLDTIIVDVPISSEEIYGRLRQYIDTLELPQRLERTDMFVQYLVDSENLEFKEHPEYLNAELTSKYFARTILDNFQENRVRIALNSGRKKVGKTSQKTG